MRDVGGVWCGLHAKGSDSIELELHHYCELVDNCHDNGAKFEQEQHSQWLKQTVDDSCQ
jgi:hypothetical protein